MTIESGFSKDQVYCVMDYETYSEASLKEVGAYEYSLHPSTEILCMSWRVGTRETLRTAKTLSYSIRIPGMTTFNNFFDTVFNPEVVLVAHNALFEQVITKNVYARRSVVPEFKKIPSSRWICTASLAAALALPRKLEAAGAALNLPVQKDMEGHKLMLKYCKPRKPTKNNPDKRFLDRDGLRRVIQYCETDIEATVELFLKLPPLTPNERLVWLLDQKINLRGFAVDRPLVEAVLKMIAEETVNLDRRTFEVTDGALRSATQRAAVLQWLEDNGLFLPDLQKKTVEDALADGLAEDERLREMLWLRLATSKSSTAKYLQIKNRSASDARVRDNFLYHGASPGRWTGTGVQPQNFPRGKLKNSIQAAKVLADADLEWVRTIYGEPMDVFSNCLRNTVVAAPGKTLDVADFAAIEARVLFWVANHETGLKAFREGRDLYKELATDIYHTSLDAVTGDQRFVGKTATLGCGYGMGWKKFKAQCLQMGQAVSDDTAQAAVETYREKHQPVKRLWSMLERAALAAVENLGKRYSINHTAWQVKGGILWCELPSGRKLAFYGPEIRYEKPPYGGEKRPVLYHYSVNSLTKKWELDKTYGGLLTENVVQAIARDLMAAAMLRIEAAGWEIVLHVHDEIVAERSKKSNANVTRFCALMAELPPWAAGCPVMAEGWSGDRYRK